MKKGCVLNFINGGTIKINDYSYKVLGRPAQLVANEMSEDPE